MAMRAPASTLLSLPTPSPSRIPPTGASDFLLLGRSPATSSTPHLCSASRPPLLVRASDDSRADGVSSLLGDDLLRRVSACKDADQALDIIAEERGGGAGTVGTDDCCAVIQAALERGNAELALSVFSAMRAEFYPVVSENGNSFARWRWARPNIHTYALLVRGLAASLRVSDAIKTISYISKVGVSVGDEVPFGKIIRCPMCEIAIAVAQPQNGIQVAACAKCCYQYELVSGDITSIDSEEISMDISAWEKGLRFLQITKSIPVAVHSIVVRTPSGVAQTHRFGTKTVELPAQEGERVTMSLAASSELSRGLGPFKVSARSPDFSPGEPLSLTNHNTGLESPLLRAPSKDRNSVLSPTIIFPALALLASGDAATGFIDPSLPKSILIAFAASVTLGTAFKGFVLPRLNQLPQNLVDVVAIKQQLLSQYDTLQVRIRDLVQASEKEIWTLARMCQLEKKIVAVGDSSYRARRSKVKRVRENLEKSLSARIELIESYAKISSMIEIEVEMDSNVLAAEAASSAESIAEQIQQIMEIENLEERWRIQAEANDEVERLLSSQPLSPDVV